MYRKGEGVPHDDLEATRWYLRAAEQGDAEAQYNSGLAYYHGRGIPQDYQQAVRWYRKAAETGNPDAQNNLGSMYDYGEGVPQDYIQAHKWFNLAASTASDNEKRERAVKNRNIVEKKMPPSQVAEAQRLAREWKPSADISAGRTEGSVGSQLSMSGTGIIVSRQGYVMTNQHVVEGCRTLRAKAGGKVEQLSIVGIDARNDLAVLKLPHAADSMARFREGRNIRPGDPVVVVGFPFHGVLASEANVTTGTVNALAGLGNDSRYLQISAPVQPGNSGGPLFDQSGNVAGIVVSKFDAMKVARATGDIPQNINFAISGTVAKAFLDAHGVEYETAISTKKIEAAEIGASAKKFTVLIECYR
jgi:uncharacterized protein